MNETEPETETEMEIFQINETEAKNCSLAVGLLVIPAFFGFIVYFFFLFAVLLDKKMRKNPFFLLAFSQGISDFLILGQFLVNFPIANCTNFSALSPGFFANLSWFSALPTMIFISAERFATISHKEFHEKANFFQK